MTKKDLTHIDPQGNAHMVDVGFKPFTDRLAVAKGEVWLNPQVVEMIRERKLKKGDVFTVAEIAGIQAAKKTCELIPLCHQIPIHLVEVNIAFLEGQPGVEITATVKTNGQTGAEMEALIAVSVAALTIYDMIKAVQKDAKIQNIRLVEKSGGRSGDVHNA